MSRHFELPLQSDPSSRFLPWIVCLMTYLASLCLSIFLVLSGGMTHWRDDLAGQMAVQVLSSGTPEDDQERLEETLELLGGTPGILSVNLLSPPQIDRLLSPWLGGGNLMEDFPVPRMIIVKTTPRDFDVGALRTQIAKIGKDVVVDDHQSWLGDIILLSRSLEALLLFIALCVTAAAGATVAFVARSGLDVHGDVIEVLHLIGAQDSYIARQFQAHVFRLSLRGSLIGFLCALATIAILSLVASGVNLALPAGIESWQWMVLVSVPLACVFITTLTARVTVMLVLARLL